MSERTDRGTPVMDRRDALRAGLLVGVAMWTVPLAQAVQATPAAADSPSAAPAPSTGGGAEAAREVAAPQALASTGSGTPEALLAGAGAAAVATGAVLLTRGQRARRSSGRHQA